MFSWAYCTLQNKMGPNKMEQNEMKICTLRYGNLYFLQICSLGILVKREYLKRRHVFLATLCLEIEQEQIKLAKKNFTLTCSFQKVSWTLVFRGN